MVVGPTNSGKTRLSCRVAKQVIMQKHTNQLVIISPNYRRDPQLQELAQHAARTGLAVIVYEQLDHQAMEKFVALIDKSKLEGKSSLVYVDDPVGVSSFTESVNRKSPFNHFYTSIKHYDSDCIFSTQSTKSLSTTARENVEVFIYLPNIVARKKLYEACPFVPSMAEFERLMDCYANDDYHALWINIQFGRLGVYAMNPQGQISSITAVPQ